MATVQEAAEKQDFKMLFITAIITSMVFVVGLFWNEAMKAAIEFILPASDEVTAKFAAAILVTAIVGTVVFFLYRSMKFAETATRGIASQAIKMKYELEKMGKELEDKQKKLERELKKSGRRL